MKKYITYKCNQCKRTIDKQINNLQPFLDKCDITLNCRGKLKPIFIKSTRNLRASSSDLEDWMPRYNDNYIQSKQIEKPEFINLANSFNNHLVLAVEEQQFNDSNIELKFSIQHENNFNYIEYTYYVEPGTTSLSGKDNSNNSQILRYTSEDELIIYVNGKQILESADIDGFQKAIVNNVGYIINFNFPILFKSTIKIIVYKQQPIIESNPIEFKLNSELVNNSEISWDNITKIHFNNKNYLIYICSDITNISMNSRLNLYPSENDLDLSKSFFLISTPNYTIIDRNKIQVIPLNNLVEDNTFIKIEIKNSKYTCSITADSIVDIFPEISYLQFKNSSLEYINERSIISTEIIKNIPNKFIIGPS